MSVRRVSRGLPTPPYRTVLGSTFGNLDGGITEQKISEIVLESIWSCLCVYWNVFWAEVFRGHVLRFPGF